MLWSHLATAVTAIALGVGAFFMHVLKTPGDLDRAELLDRIAAGAVALVVSKFPGLGDAQLIEQVVLEILSAKNPPTTNRKALERAAAAAVATAKGANPRP